ncbi:MAG: hypothetical protein UX17_C0040G0003 [Parcubacteria group bacterium GW2011_GWC2_45_7]|nr:MAG: hypothetical protein UX17_C0040G0003 [Parcubacteria group bacterium GW2011_GWC2_45_7]
MIITTKRVVKIRQVGFFDRTVSEMLLSRINDVSHRIRGFWSTIFHYGTLHIVAGNGETVLDFEYMQNPGKALKILNGLLQRLPSDDGGAGLL